MIGYMLFFAVIGGIIGVLNSFTTNKWKEKLKAFLIPFLITMAFGGILLLDGSGQESRWNDGICSNCGGYYEFKNASTYRSSTHYYYQCDTCHTIFETTYNFTPVK